jgi:hypothetical protein
MSFTAIIPVAQMAAANAFLENSERVSGRGSWGPDNFSVPAYAGAAPTHALFHSWDIAGFRADVEQIVGVVIREGNTPFENTTAAATAAGATWGQDAKPLTGTVTPGLYVNDDGLWWVIQQYDTAIWPDPLLIPALIVRARVPGEIVPWYQTGQHDAFKLVNAFTGLPDRCTYQGKTWVVTLADGAGNNTWAPDVYGWAEV